MEGKTPDGKRKSLRKGKIVCAVSAPTGKRPRGRPPKGSATGAQSLPITYCLEPALSGKRKRGRPPCKVQTTISGTNESASGYAFDDQPLPLSYSLDKSNYSGNSALTDEYPKFSIEEAETPPAPVAIRIPEAAKGSSPFTKNSPVWSVVESMQAFQTFPQTPHFLPLIEQKKCSREGLAIGHMVTFANIVEKAYNSNITDPTHSFFACLESLQDLKPLGFSISAVEGRLRKMLSAAEEFQKLTSERVEVEGQILELTHGNIEIETEVKQLNEMIQKLQEKVVYAEAMRKENNAKISALKGSLAKILDSVQKIQLDVEDDATH